MLHVGVVYPVRAVSIRGPHEISDYVVRSVSFFKDCEHVTRPIGVAAAYCRCLGLSPAFFLRQMIVTKRETPDSPIPYQVASGKWLFKCLIHFFRVLVVLRIWDKEFHGRTVYHPSETPDGARNQRNRHTCGSRFIVYCPIQRTQIQARCRTYIHTPTNNSEITAMEIRPTAFGYMACIGLCRCSHGGTLLFSISRHNE